MTDIKSNPIYQEACVLMEARKEKEIDIWKKKKLKQVKKDYANISDMLLSRYETTLEQYANTLKRAYASYQGATGDAQKERIVRKLVTTDRSNLSSVIQSMDSARKQAKGKPVAGKKSSWWKHALGYGTLLAALTGTLWYKNSKDQTQSTPSETDKVPERVEQRATGMVTKESSSRSLLGRLQSTSDQSMSHPSYVTEDDVFEAQKKALLQRNTISGLDVQGSANQAAIANNMAITAGAKRRINYDEQRMKVDTVESWEDVSRSVERTTGNLRGTIQQATGSVNAFRDFGRALRGRK